MYLVVTYASNMYVLCLSFSSPHIQTANPLDVSALSWLYAGGLYSC